MPLRHLGTWRIALAASTVPSEADGTAPYRDGHKSATSSFPLWVGVLGSASEQGDAPCAITASKVLRPVQPRLATGWCPPSFPDPTPEDSRPPVNPRSPFACFPARRSPLTRRQSRTSG